MALLNASLDAHLPMPPVNPPVADTAPAAPAPAASSRSPAVNPTLIKGALALLVLLLAAGVGYRLLTQGASAPATSPLAAPAVESALPQAALNPEPASSAAPVSAAPSVDSKPAELKPEPAKPEALAVAPVKPAEVKPAEAKPTSTDTSTAQAAVSDTGAGELVLNAREKAWVSVIDAKGKKLLYGQISGEKRLGAGTPPYKLIIGNAPQVELNYKGQAVPLADKTKGSTAKLELQ